MLWVTQLDRISEIGGERETFQINMDEEEAGLARGSGGGEAQRFCRSEREKMGGQGKSFQLHKWLRAARQNDEWRGKSKPSSNGLGFFFGGVGVWGGGSRLAFSGSHSVPLSPSPLSTQLSTLPGATGSVWKFKLQHFIPAFLSKLWKVSSSWGKGRVGGRKARVDKQLKTGDRLWSHQLVSITQYYSDIQAHPRK